MSTASNVLAARNTALGRMQSDPIKDAKSSVLSQYPEVLYGGRLAALGSARQTRAHAKYQALALKTERAKTMNLTLFSKARADLDGCDLSKIGTKDLAAILMAKNVDTAQRKQLVEKLSEIAECLEPLAKDTPADEFKAICKFAMAEYLKLLIASKDAGADAGAGVAQPFSTKTAEDVYINVISPKIQDFRNGFRTSNNSMATTIGSHLIGETYFNGGLAAVNAILRNLLPSCSFSLAWMAPGVATATLTVAFIVATTPAVVKYAKVLATTNNHNLAYAKAHNLWATSEGRWFEGAFSGLWVSPVWMLMNALYSPLVSFHTILYPQIFLGLTLKSCFEKELAKLDEKMPKMQRVRTAAFNTVNHFDTAKALAAWLGAATLQGLFKDSFKFNFGASDAANAEFNARPFASDQYDFAITMLSAFVFIFSYLKLAEHIKANWKAAPSAAPAADDDSDKKDN